MSSMAIFECIHLVVAFLFMKQDPSIPNNLGNFKQADDEVNISFSDPKQQADLTKQWKSHLTNRNSVFIAVSAACITGTTFTLPTVLE